MKVVISYRRADSQDIAGRICDHLRRRFGDRNVFFDIGSIPAGADFREAVDTALRLHGVLVAVIGPGWSGPRNYMQDRIHDDDDPVRTEIGLALKNGLRIIPVLVNGARIPAASELPPGLDQLAYRNALTIESGRHFDHQIGDLIRAIEGPRSRLGRLAAVGAIAVAMLATAWLALPQSWQLAIRAPVSPAPPSGDIEVASFRTPDGTPELDYIRHKIERNFVDLFSDARLRVRSSLTTNQSLDQTHFTLGGRIAERSGQVLVSVELRDARGVIVGSSQLEAKQNELERLSRVVPEALMIGMDVETLTLRRRGPAARPTGSVEALAHFLQARREVNSRNFADAERSLKLAIEVDRNFAMAYWAMGEVRRLQGDDAQAKEWYDTATRMHPDHARWSIQPALETQPVPHLLSGLRAAPLQELEQGVRYRIVRLPDYGINMHVWAFDPQRFDLTLRPQATVSGHAVADFLTEPGDVFAINGGFFDLDSRERLTPSGLLIVDHVLHRDLTDKGSGVVFSKAGEVGIAFRQDFRRAGVRHAVQSGPLVVDPGGKLGIYRNDFDRQNRSAICLDGESIVVILADGGLSLYELGEVLSARRDSGGLGCNVALNLDGGPSAQAMFRSPGHLVSLVGRWRIQNALVLSRRDRQAERHR